MNRLSLSSPAFIVVAQGAGSPGVPPGINPLRTAYIYSSGDDFSAVIGDPNMPYATMGSALAALNALMLSDPLARVHAYALDAVLFGTESITDDLWIGGLTLEGDSFDGTLTCSGYSPISLEVYTTLSTFQANDRNDSQVFDLGSIAGTGIISNFVGKGQPGGPGGPGGDINADGGGGSNGESGDPPGPGGTGSDGGYASAESGESGVVGFNGYNIILGGSVNINVLDLSGGPGGQGGNGGNASANGGSGGQGGSAEDVNMFGQPIDGGAGGAGGNGGAAYAGSAGPGGIGGSPGVYTSSGGTVSNDISIPGDIGPDGYSGSAYANGGPGGYGGSPVNGGNTGSNGSDGFPGTTG